MLASLTRYVAMGNGFAAVQPGRTVHTEGNQLKTHLCVSILIAYGVTITFLHAVAFNVHLVHGTHPLIVNKYENNLRKQIRFL